MTLKMILLVAAFAGASTLSAFAQAESGSPSRRTGGAARISPSTHCLDRTTNQPRLRTAADESARRGRAGTTGRASGGGPGMGGPTMSESGMERGGMGTGGTGTRGSTRGSRSTAAMLQPC